MANLGLQVLTIHGQEERHCRTSTLSSPFETASNLGIPEVTDDSEQQSSSERVGPRGIQPLVSDFDVDDFVEQSEL